MEYGAIDLHTRESEIRIVNEDGAEVFARRVATRPEALARVFADRAALRVLLESGTESEWVAQCLEGWGHTVVVADPSYAAMYGARQRRIKTDRRDVAALAEANRRGWYRPAHRVSRAQQTVREALTIRRTLINQRTQLIAVVRTLVRRQGSRVPTGQAETFVARLRQAPLPVDLQTALAPLLIALEGLAPLIAAADQAATVRARADAVVRRLMTAPGVGPITALNFRAALDQVDRFADAGAVTSYLGLVPREHSSGDHQRKGRITKAGPREPRAMLVQASWTIWRMRRGPGLGLALWAQRVAARRGRRVAIVALARRLARILFAIWRDDQPYRESVRHLVAA